MPSLYTNTRSGRSHSPQPHDARSVWRACSPPLEDDAPLAEAAAAVAVEVGAQALVGTLEDVLEVAGGLWGPTVLLQSMGVGIIIEVVWVNFSTTLSQLRTTRG